MSELDELKQMLENQIIDRDEHNYVGDPEGEQLNLRRIAALTWAISQIERPAVTDSAIQRVIEYISRYDTLACTDEGYEFHYVDEEDRHIILCALQQYRKPPTDSAIQAAIEWVSDGFILRDHEYAPPHIYEIVLMALRQMQGWIPISERLPDGDGMVICHWTDGTIQTYWGERIAEWNDAHDADDRITHWQPLPGPPKDGE